MRAVVAFLVAVLLGVAHADEVVRIFSSSDDCYITTELKVEGDRRAACVELLEMKARLARAEMRVNERRRR